MTHHMEMLCEFYPEGDNNVFLLFVCLIPVSFCYGNEKEETARLWELTATHVSTSAYCLVSTRQYADARVRRNDRLCSDTDEVQTQSRNTQLVKTYCTWGEQGLYAVLHSGK